MVGVVLVLLGGIAVALYQHYVALGLPSDAAEALDHPEQLTLYSLEPLPQPGPRGKVLDGYTVLGERILSLRQGKLAIRAFRIAMQYNGPMDACFDPRHAIRINSNAHSFDYLICYSCSALEVFRDGKLIYGAQAGGSSAALDDLLTRNGLPLSKSE